VTVGNGATTAPDGPATMPSGSNIAESINRYVEILALDGGFEMIISYGVFTKPHNQYTGTAGMRAMAGYHSRRRPES